MPRHLTIHQWFPAEERRKNVARLESHLRQDQNLEPYQNHWSKPQGVQPQSKGMPGGRIIEGIPQAKRLSKDMAPGKSARKKRGSVFRQHKACGLGSQRTQKLAQRTSLQKTSDALQETPEGKKCFKSFSSDLKTKAARAAPFLPATCVPKAQVPSATSDVREIHRSSGAVDGYSLLGIGGLAAGIHRASSIPTGADRPAWMVEPSKGTHALPCIDNLPLEGIFVWESSLN